MQKKFDAIKHVKKNTVLELEDFLFLWKMAS